jgi:curved DNA-binding protein
MAQTDYYKTLGVSQSASDDEIRKAYKKLVRQYHPDACPNDKEAAAKFKEVQDAYAILNDPQKRDMFDRFGSAAFESGGQGPFQQQWSPGAGGTGPGSIDIEQLFGGAGGPVGLGDLFGGVFGGGGGGGEGGGGRRARQRSRRSRKGADLRTSAQIPFGVAAEGGDHDVHLQRDGQSERLTVKIPPGIADGSVIRLAGQGHLGHHGGENGDLRVTIQVAAHPYFRRESNNLLLDVPITIAEATLGAKVEVPTLCEGMVVLTVPPGTSSGAKLRLRGKGIADQKTKVRGDQIVVLKIVVPDTLSDRAKELVEELAEAAPQTPRSSLW